MARIGIYAPVAPARTGGVGRWLDGLLKGLQAIDGDNEYWLLGGEQLAAPNFHAYPLAVRAETRYRNHLFVALGVPRLARKLRLDLVHVPNTMPILGIGCPTVVSVYDVVEFGLPRRVYEPMRHHYRRLVHRLVARRATHIITGTRHARGELIQWLNVPPERVTALYPGLESFFRPPNPEKVEVVRASYELPRRYVLFVGKIQPRKNVVRLLRAFRKVNARLPDVELVLAGRSAWMADEVEALIQAPDLRGIVHRTGFVADDALPALYAGAALLAFPSLYEGFGFPVLEAMACGTPVLTSNGTSLAEVAGSAAYLVDPLNEESLVQGMLEMLTDGELHDMLRARGFRRANDFSWIHSARETRALYESLIGGRDPHDPGGSAGHVSR